MVRVHRSYAFLLMGVTFLLGASIARASVLTFDRSGTAGQFTGFSGNALFGSPSTTAFPDYGDRITGSSTDASVARGQSAGTTVFDYGTAGGDTPHVVVDYFVGDGFVDGDTNNPAPLIAAEGAYVYAPANNTSTEPAYFPYSTDTGMTRLFTLNADASYNVDFQAFQLGNFGLTSTVSLRLVEVDGVGAQIGGPLWSNASASIPGAGRTFTSADFGTISVQRVALEFDPVGGLNNYSLDNIQFGEEFVPEPAAAGMFALTFVAVARRRQRHAH